MTVYSTQDQKFGLAIRRVFAFLLTFFFGKIGTQGLVTQAQEPVTFYHSVLGKFLTRVQKLVTYLSQHFK